MDTGCAPQDFPTREGLISLKHGDTERMCTSGRGAGSNGEEERTSAKHTGILLSDSLIR